MKKVFFVFGCLFMLNAGAQKTIEGMMNAEKSFAAYAVANGTRDAFLKYLDSNGVVFERTKPVNSIEAWSKRRKSPGILNWHPQYAEIASSGDFGYISGPWTFQKASVTDSILATGQFNSIWRINKNGEWRNVLDLGNELPGDFKAPEHKVEVKKITKKGADQGEILKAEQAFIDMAKTDPVLAYKSFLSANSVLNHNGHPSAAAQADKDILIKGTPSAIQYEVLGSGMATSGDLAYVYGLTQVNDKKENYLRVWRREKAGWRIALEVLRQ